MELFLVILLNINNALTIFVVTSDSNSQTVSGTGKERSDVTNWKQNA